MSTPPIAGDTVAIPTLDGIISDPADVCDYMLSCFYANKNLQSISSQGSVASLSYLITIHRNDNLALQQSVQAAIENMFEPIYEVVALNVVVRDNDVDTQTTSIQFNCTIRYNNTEHNVGHLVQYVDGRLKSIQNLE